MSGAAVLAQGDKSELVAALSRQLAEAEAKIVSLESKLVSFSQMLKGTEIGLSVHSKENLRLKDCLAKSEKRAAYWEAEAKDTYDQALYQISNWEECLAQKEVEIARMRFHIFQLESFKDARIKALESRLAELEGLLQVKDGSLSAVAHQARPLHGRVVSTTGVFSRALQAVKPRAAAESSALIAMRP